jgi:peptide-methionine (S)-S-oxide reductase
MWKPIALAAMALGIATAADIPAPAQDAPKPSAKTRQTAVLAGGCFWCTEAVFEAVTGVERVVSGYSGGTAQTAQYKLVGEGRTDHAEAIEVTFDASRISYGQILQIFFAVAHDPTQLNRQGPDWGRQYRSAIFYSNEEQKKIAEAYIAQLTAAQSFKSKIVTEVVPLKAFYIAEDYHQDYVKHNPMNPYVQVNSVPKVAKLKKTYPQWVKK